MRFNRYKILISAPYVIAFIVAVLFYFFSFNVNNNLSDLFIDLSASFVAIPLVLIFVELLRGSINQKLEKELFDYAKKNVDNDILSTIAYINRLFNFPIVPTNSPLLNSIASVLNFNPGMVGETLDALKPLGFQLFKDWGETKKYFSDVLQNPLAIRVFSTEQISVLIQLLKVIQSFETDLNNSRHFELIGDLSAKYKLAKGTDISFHNVVFPNRWILLENTPKPDEHIVRDFGDFEEYYEDRLLKQYKLTVRGKIELAEDINKIIHFVNRWLDLTGNEFIFDSKRFRGAIRER